MTRPATGPLGRTLVAGIGNVFLGDDGFGVEAIRRLPRADLPEDVEVADYGIRGVHLAYQLLDGGYDTTVLVDALQRGGEPGTLYLFEPDLEAQGAVAVTDAHGMTPDAVFGLLRKLGGNPGRVLVVGCEPATVEERMGLSEPVGEAVEGAVEMLLELIDKGPPRGAAVEPDTEDSSAAGDEASPYDPAPS